MGRRRFDALVVLACRACALVGLGGVVWLLADVVRHGASRLSWSFLLEAPLDFGRAGGIGPILVSTAWILGVCLGCAVPLGLGAGLYLAEFASRAGWGPQLARRSLDVLAAVPSVVFGLFGAAFFCDLCGMGYSILAGGLTLACMVLPLAVRTTEEGLRGVGSELRLGGAALGLSRAAVLRRLLLPAALPALAVGLVLSIGRAMAETAALLFTSGYATRMPDSLADPGRALSVHVYDLALHVPGGEGAAYASALVLALFLLVIDAAAAWMAHRWLRSRWRPL